VRLALKLTLNPDEEMASLVRGLGGEFVPAAPGGDVIRDGVGVLPTGRNIHALDPYRIPGEVAMARGRTAARLVIEAHQRAAAVAAVTGRGAATSSSAYPETVAVTLWGLDTIKTKGESIAIVLALVGAEPVREGTGRVVGFALTPLAQLGRPRIDVLGSLSGIFRDSFGNVLDLLDDMFERAAYCDEPEDMNFIKKHTAALAAKGVERPFSRLFSNPPGDFGSLVGDQIGAGDWSDATELGNTWQGRNAFSYGRQGASVGSQQQGLGGEGAGGGFGPTNGGGNSGGAEKGAFRPEVLSTLLSTTERIVQEIDSVEYGLTDIQEYYANTGALKKAAENNQAAGRRVAVSVIESFEKEVKPRDLEETLRLEYRSKLLNPKWAEAMAAQGAGGAYEISGRMTAMIGWAATTDFAEQVRGLLVRLFSAVQCVSLTIPFPPPVGVRRRGRPLRARRSHGRPPARQQPGGLPQHPQAHAGGQGPRLLEPLGRRAGAAAGPVRGGGGRDRGRRVNDGKTTARAYFVLCQQQKI
jgi:magnesium chelatase subunit H